MSEPRERRFAGQIFHQRQTFDLGVAARQIAVRIQPRGDIVTRRHIRHRRRGVHCVHVQEHGFAGLTNQLTQRLTTRHIGVEHKRGGIFRERERLHLRMLARQFPALREGGEKIVRQRGGRRRPFRRQGQRQVGLDGADREPLLRRRGRHGGVKLAETKRPISQHARQDNGRDHDRGPRPRAGLPPSQKTFGQQTVDQRIRNNNSGVPPSSTT